MLEDGFGCHVFCLQVPREIGAAACILSRAGAMNRRYEFSSKYPSNPRSFLPHLLGVRAMFSTSPTDSPGSSPFLPLLPVDSNRRIVISRQVYLARCGIHRKEGVDGLPVDVLRPGARLAFLLHPRLRY